MPAGVELTEPFQALHWITAGAGGQAILPRTVVIIEDGAKVVFNDLYTSGALAEPTLAVPATEKRSAR